MGDCFSFCSSTAGKIFSKFKMLRFVVVLCVAASAIAAPGGGHYEYGYHQKHCHTKYNIKYDQKLTQLWTPHTLRSVRTLSPSTARKLTLRFTTALLLLDMIPTRFMEVTTREMLSLVMVDTPLDLTASKMSRRSATRFHNSTPDQSATKLRPRSLMRSAVALMSAETSMPMVMEVTTKCIMPHATSCIFSNKNLVKI